MDRVSNIFEIEQHCTLGATHQLMQQGRKGREQ